MFTSASSVHTSTGIMSMCTIIQLYGNIATWSSRYVWLQIQRFRDQFLCKTDFPFLKLYRNKWTYKGQVLRFIYRRKCNGCHISLKHHSKIATDLRVEYLVSCRDHHHHQNLVIYTNRWRLKQDCHQQIGAGIVSMCMYFHLLWNAAISF